MGKAGGILSIIGGIFGFIAAIVTLFVGGLGSAFQANGAHSIVGFGWGGILFSFLVIIFGAVAFARPRVAGILLIVASILGAILGGTLVAVCMALSLLGGIFAVFGAKKAVPVMGEVASAGIAVPNKKATWVWATGGVIIAVIVIILSVGKSSQKTNGNGVGAMVDGSTNAFSDNGTKTDQVLTQRPADEAAFIQIVADAQQKAHDAQNDMQKGGIKAERDKALCQSLQTSSAQHWTGKIKTIDSTSDGKGVLAVEIADNILVKTWNNALSDIAYHTVLEPGSPVFVAAARMKPGMPVALSGSFFRASDDGSGDCFKESSVRLSGKLREPEFIFKFDFIAPLAQTAPPPAAASMPSPIAAAVADRPAQAASLGNNVSGELATEPQSFKTAAGLLAKSILPDGNPAVTLNGVAVFHGDDAQWQFPVQMFKLSSNRDAVLMASSGGRGNSCETLFFFLVIDASGNKSTPEFGSCSPQGSFSQVGDKITVTTLEMGGKNISVFDGVTVTEKDGPVKLVDSIDPSK